MIEAIRQKVTSEPIETGLATFLNPYSYLKLRRAPELYSEMNAIYIDGIALVMALRLVGIKVSRRSLDMTSLAPHALRSAAEKGWNIILVGGRDGVSEKAAKILCNHLDIPRAKAYSGYFRSESARAEVVSQIVRSNPSLVLVGMGAVMQEQLMIQLKREGHRGIVYSCGGFLHQTALSGSSQYYPPVIDTLHMRWMWRMLKEPSTIHRYLVQYPKFLAAFAADVIGLNLK